VSMVAREPIEGFMVELASGAIFEVKGLIHPPGRVVAYPRYLPDPKGDRVRQGSDVRYRKLASWKERLALLAGPLRRYLVRDPVLGDVLCEPPLAEAKAIFSPVDGLEDLRRSGDAPGVGLLALEMAEEVRARANLAWREIGISGSVLVGLARESSDIDLVFYGKKACSEAYRALKAMREEGLTRPCGPRELRAIYLARSADTPYDMEAFFSREPSKVLQGTFKSVFYSVRLIPAVRQEPYGLVRFRNLGTAVVRASVSDASESIFTPCRYGLEYVELLSGVREPEALVSFRLRFCEHASEGELIEARGKLEEALWPDGRREIRLVVGGRPGDYFTPSRAPGP